MTKRKKAGVQQSGHEFYAEGLAVTPDDFACLAIRVFRHKRQHELVPDIDRSICHDLGAARRDVQYEAFNLRHPVVDRNPGRPSMQFASRFARYLYPSFVDIHDGHPSLDPIGWAIFEMVVIL